MPPPGGVSQGYALKLRACPEAPVGASEKAQKASNRLPLATSRDSLSVSPLLQLVVTLRDPQCLSSTLSAQQKTGQNFATPTVCFDGIFWGCYTLAHLIALRQLGELHLGSWSQRMVSLCHNSTNITQQQTSQSPIHARTSYSVA